MKLRAFYTVYTLNEKGGKIDQDDPKKSYRKLRVSRDFECESPSQLRERIQDAYLKFHPTLTVTDKLTNETYRVSREYAVIFGVCEVRHGEKLAKLQDAWEAEEITLFNMEEI